MRTGQFEASLEEAKLYPALWRLLLGLLFTVFFWMSITVALIGGAVGLAGLIDPMYTVHVTAALTRMQAATQGYGGIDSPLAVFLLLGSFIGLFIAPMLAAAAFHFRGPGSLFGETRDWATGFGTALAVLVPIYALMIVIGALIDPPTANLALGRWLSFLPLALPLIFIQTAAEELLFRGYLQQQLAARFAARWVWMGLPALLFAAIHYAPGMGTTLPILLAWTFIFALIAADLTEQTGTLGAAMGLHFGNNLFAMLGIAYADTITGLALYTQPMPESAFSPHALSLLIGVAMLVVVWRLTRRLLTT